MIEIEIPMRLLIPCWSLCKKTLQVEFTGRCLNALAEQFISENFKSAHFVEEYNESFEHAGVRLKAEECDLLLMRMYFGF